MELPPIDTIERFCSIQDYHKNKENELLNLANLGCTVRKEANHTLVSHPTKTAPYYNRVVLVDSDREGLVAIVNKYQNTTNGDKHTLVIDDFTRPVEPEARNVLEQLGVCLTDSFYVLGGFTNSVDINKSMFFDNPPFEVVELTDDQNSIDRFLHSQAGRFFSKPGETPGGASERVRYNLSRGFIYMLSDQAENIVGMFGSVISSDGVASLYSGFVEEGSRKKGGSSLLVLKTLERLKSSCDYCYFKSKNPVVIWTANKFFGLKPQYKETHYLI